MKIEILSIFPGIFEGFLRESLIGKACERGLLSVELTNIRDFAPSPHHKVDDAPYGGGAGMVMSAEVVARAVEAAKGRLPRAPVVLLSPAGAKFSQAEARRLSGSDEVILLCGRYEGIDQRVIDLLVDEELSIGDYVLMGGEVPAMVLIEAIVRLQPEVLGNEASATAESFEPTPDGQLLEAPHYTRPAQFRGMDVPPVLLSGDHAKIEAWRREESLKRTTERRPDLTAPRHKGV